MGTVNTTTTISGDDRALLEARIATEQQQIFNSKAVLSALGMNIVKPLAGNEKSQTWHWEGFGTGTMLPKAKGTARPRSTTAKGSKTIAFDGVEYYTEGYDWFDSAHFPTWPVLQNAVRRGTQKYLDKLETRLTILLAAAAQGASESGTHSGGVYKQITSGTTVAARYAASNTGAELFDTDVAEVDAAFMGRQEALGQNKVMIITPYIARQVITKSDKFMSRDYNANAPFSGGPTLMGNSNFIGTYGNYPVLVSRYLTGMTTNNTTDNVSKYQLDMTYNSGTKLGVPAALFAYYDANFSPIGTVRSYAPAAQMWYNTDEDENVCGIKSLEGHDTLHVWNAGGIFIHS